MLLADSSTPKHADALLGGGGVGGGAGGPGMGVWDVLGWLLLRATLIFLASSAVLHMALAAGMMGGGPRG